MRYEALEKLRRRVLGRRLAVTKLREHAIADADGLRAEREPDWEDAAALSTTAALLEKLGDAERDELARIDAALARMERGVYGLCVVCGRPIAAARLEAVPEADRCSHCARPR